MIICLPRFRVFPAVCLIVASYFIYHGIYGAHGYRRLKQVQTEITLARQVAAEVSAKRAALEIKVKSLSENSLDRDQLAESALRILNMGQPDNIIILTGQ